MTVTGESGEHVETGHSKRSTDFKQASRTLVADDLVELFAPPRLGTPLDLGKAATAAIVRTLPPVRLKRSSHAAKCAQEPDLAQPVRLAGKVPGTSGKPLNLRR